MEGEFIRNHWKYNNFKVYVLLFPETETETQRETERETEEELKPSFLTRFSKQGQNYQRFN